MIDNFRKKKLTQFEKTESKREFFHSAWKSEIKIQFRNYKSIKLFVTFTLLLLDS